MHNASASKTDNLFYCQYWASPAVTLPPEPEVQDDIPRFGSAFHKCCENHLLGLPVFIKAIGKEFDVDPVRLKDYYHRWRKVFTDFLIQRGWQDRVKIVEKKITYDPFQDKMRFLESEGGRDYSKRKPMEFPGTADLVLEPTYNEPFVVFDWKSGQSTYDAAKNGQLKSLALGFSRHFKQYEARVFIIRIDDEFIEPSEAFVGPETLNRHRMLLRKNLLLAMDSNPPLRMGYYCKYCPALEVCPAHQQPLALADIDLVDHEHVANMYDRIIAGEELLKKKRNKIRQFVESNGPVGLNNGKNLEIKEYNEETISKSSIIRALGGVEGNELLAKLRAMGVVESKTTQQLRPMLDPSARKK